MGGMNTSLSKDKLYLIKRLLERNGYKFTKQRKLILEELFAADRHLNAEDIYERLKKKNIGLATVYRNVKIFTSIGIVKEIVVDGVSHYELKIYCKKPLHAHFQCIECNNIIDIEKRKIVLKYLNLNKMIEETNNVDIYDVDIMFIGLCKKCKKKDKLEC